MKERNGREHKKYPSYRLILEKYKNNRRVTCQCAEHVSKTRMKQDSQKIKDTIDGTTCVTNVCTSRSKIPQDL